MTKKKKWLIYGGAGVALAALAIFLGLRYLPIYKLMKRPSSEDMAFINQPQGPGSGPFSLSFDFEVDPKASIPGDIYQGIAHSGQYSTKTFGKNTFSVSFEKRVGELNVKDIKAVALSAWIYVFPGSGEPEGSLVFTVTNTVGVNTCWKGVSVHGPFVPREKWFKISGSFDMSDVNVRPDDKIQIYFWNNSDTKILSDDFYVVFGKQTPRRGDSTLVDITRSAYQPRFNFPPFPVFMLQLEETPTGNENTLDITPNDQVVAGRFLASEGGLESVCVVKPDGEVVLYHYCKEAGFRKIRVDCPESVRNELNEARIFKGFFKNQGNDQLLISGKKRTLLLAFDKTVNPCAKEELSLSLKELWSSGGAEINGTPVPGPDALIPCDLDGDRITELLVLGERGSWQVLRFANEGWTTVSNGKENRIGEWDDKYTDFKITPGKFLKGSNADLLLTVFSEKSKKKYAYSLVRFSPAEKRFVKALNSREGTVGITIGMDTLKPSDQFIFGRFTQATEGMFLRYNRDWRYDLKEMVFNDSTFAILANVDFSGYPKDQNPKFYETLKLVPGRLINPAETALLIIARNCKDRNYQGGVCKEWEDLPYMPNTLRIYSFNPKSKP